jgi:hypothetical protein
MSVYGKIGLIASVILSIVIAGSAASLPDEMVVRSSYAKISMAFEIDRLQPALRNENRPASNEHLHVNISDLRLGPIQDILNTPLEDLVTKPGGYVLDASMVTNVIPGNSSGTLKLHTVMATGWKVAPYLSEDWRFPFADLLNGSDVIYTRYANFRVNLTFMGRQRSYSALFLFGTGRDGKPQIFALDHIIGTSLLNGLLSAPIPDEIKTIQLGFRDRADVKRFLASVEPQKGCELDSGSQLCCNPASGHCGVNGLAPVGAAPGSIFLGTFPSPGSLSVQSSAATNDTCSAGCSVFNSQYDETQNIPASAIGTMEHTNGGSHTGAVSFRGKCTYNGKGIPCIPLCHVDFVSGPSTGDTGVFTWTNFCHVLGANGLSNGGDSTCSASAGWGAAACQGCKCGLNVTINGNGGVVTGSVSGGSGSVIWESGVATHSWHCPTIN